MDMLIKLYDLPDSEAIVEALELERICIRRAMAYERRTVGDWVLKNFNALWAEECATAFGRQPVGCYIAVKGDTLCGFCCLGVTFRNFIGPIGIGEDMRSKGVGRSLLLMAADEMHKSGYAYAVIGDVGEPGFFKRAANAVEIPESSPGPYPSRI